MDQDNVAIRLKVFIDSEGLTHSQFADRCGIPRPSLSQILSGRNKKISDVIVGQIHKTFPNLSVLWLMFGEGPMLNGSSADSSSRISDSDLSFPEGGLFADNLNFASGRTINENRGNLSGLNKPQDTSINTHIQQVNDNLKIIELQKQIDKIRENPRKVKQITVYYDDSTFETFYPVGGN